MRVHVLFVTLLLATAPASGERLQQEPDLDFQATEVHLETRQARIDPDHPLTLTMAPAETSAADEINAMRAWNAAGQLPSRVGIIRSLPGVIRFDLENPVSASGSTVLRPHSSSDGEGLTARIRVEGSDYLRARLEHVSLDPASQLWVSGSDGRQYRVHQTASPGTEIWTPMVRGPELILHLETGGASSGSFEISKLGQLFFPRPEPLAAAGEECVEDASCYDSSTLDVIDPYRRAVAALVFESGGGFGFCTGALMNDTDTSTSIPYMLTANHCFSSQPAASSIEAFWDYRTSNCNGLFPELSTLPRSSGSTLLVTSASTDVTLVRLTSVPAGRASLGWSANPSSVPNGAVLHRISHPFSEDLAIPYPQTYTRAVVDTTFGTCGGRSRPNYVYSRLLGGATLGGSSGAPVILQGGFVVGQLLGGCGPDENVCSQNNREVDGALSISFPLLAQYLDPGSSTPDTCTPSQTTACLLNGRFRATLRYRNQFDDQPVNTSAFVKPVTGFADPNFETAFFYFNSPNNIEVMLKMLDQGNTNSQGQPTIAVLFGTATPLRAEVTITDMETGATKTYASGFNQMRGTTDFVAFVK